MDIVRCKVQCSVFHEGKMIKKLPYSSIDFMAGLSGPCVHVQVLGCRNITASDFGGTSDPYVVAMFQGKKLGLTRVRPRTLNPRWVNETFVVPVADNLPAARNMPRSQKGLFRLEVYDYDWIGANDFLGNVEMSKEKLKALAALAKQQPILLPLTMQEFHGVLGIRIGVSDYHVSVKIERAESLDKFNAFSDGRPFVKVFFGEEYLGKTPFEYDSGAVTWHSGNEFLLKINDVLKRERTLLKKKARVEEAARQKIIAQVMQQRKSIRLNKKGAKEVEEAKEVEAIDLTEDVETDKHYDKIFRFEVYEYNYIASHSLLGTVHFPVEDLRRLCPKLPKRLITERTPKTYLDNNLQAQRTLFNMKGNICCAGGGIVIEEEEDPDEDFWERTFPAPAEGAAVEEEEEEEDLNLQREAAVKKKKNAKAAASVETKTSSDKPLTALEDATLTLAASKEAEKEGLTKENLELLAQYEERDHAASTTTHAAQQWQMGANTSTDDIPLISYDLEQDSMTIDAASSPYYRPFENQPQQKLQTLDVMSLTEPSEAPLASSSLDHLHNQMSMSLMNSVENLDIASDPIGGEQAGTQIEAPSLDAITLTGANTDSEHGEAEAKSVTNAESLEKLRVSSMLNIIPPIDLSSTQNAISGNTPHGTGRSTGRSTGTGRAPRPAPPTHSLEDETKDSTPYYLKHDHATNPSLSSNNAEQVTLATVEPPKSRRASREAIGLPKDASEQVMQYREQRIKDSTQSELVNNMLRPDSLVGAGFKPEFQPPAGAPPPEDPHVMNPTLHNVQQFYSEGANGEPIAAAPPTADQQPPLSAAERNAAEKAAKEEASRLEREKKKLEREKARLERQQQSKKKVEEVAKTSEEIAPPVEPEAPPAEPEPEVDHDLLTYFKLRHYQVEKASSKADEPESGNLGHVVVRLIPAVRGNIIAGLDEGVRHMSLGEKSAVKIRFDHAYNNYYMSEHIPARANLIFTVQLKSINGFGLLGLPLRIGKRIYRLVTFICRKTNDGIRKLRKDGAKGKLPHQRLGRYLRALFARKEKKVEEEIELLDVQEQVAEDEEEEDEEEVYRPVIEKGSFGQYMKKHVTVSVVAGAKFLFTYREKPKLSKRKKGKKGPAAEALPGVPEEGEEEEGAQEELMDLEQDNDEGYEQIPPDPIEHADEVHEVSDHPPTITELPAPPVDSAFKGLLQNSTSSLSSSQHNPAKKPGPPAGGQGRPGPPPK